LPSFELYCDSGATRKQAAERDAARNFYPNRLGCRFSSRT
jgi:hypothetical protein